VSGLDHLTKTIGWCTRSEGNEGDTYTQRC
jgi:hypothetical protein